MSEEQQSKQANQTGSSANQKDAEPEQAKPANQADSSAKEQDKAKQTSQASSSANKQGSDQDKSKPTSKAGSSAQKKEKEQDPPIEDKPFPEFIEQHFQPALKDALSQQGINDLELTFQKDEFPFPGPDQCSQVVGQWDGGKRRFNLYFLDEDISGKKAFSYTASDAPPSTIESFMIDERKVNLALLVMYTVQRLNGQKWLARN